jgi:hypothetical protein
MSLSLRGSRYVSSGVNIDIQTWRNMRPVLFTINRGGRGRLSTMARPRGGDWLTDELAGLAIAGERHGEFAE